ncbi:MAG TPA: DUF3375 domain-containing protein, partial [Longimicrobiales bacterium]|nr:DUF3375 domain-containing protein [Longimicrobiales bacterium]
MVFEYSTLDFLRHNHPAWRLLCSDHAPLIASFLHRVFIAPNVRVLGEVELVEALEDELFVLRERLGPDAYPRPALEYLNRWAANENGWLRKFYREGTDEPQYDLTPSTEKAIAWLGTLAGRTFVGTESRLLLLFDLLRQIGEGTETDPEARIAELERRRAELDTEIARVRAGELELMDDTALRERFQQFINISRELLADFREVEQNFRSLDRSVREKIARWEGGKGELIEEIMGRRDAIVDSDEGKSFQAFWDFLMSGRRQEELTRLLDRVLALPAIAALGPDPRLRRIHYDWLEAGEHTQRTVARLSQQLRRFLDDRAWLENRRIMEILHDIETNALALRESPPTGDIMTLPAMAAEIELPLERPLHNLAARVELDELELEHGDVEVDASALFNHIVIDKMALARQIGMTLRERPQVTLGQICERYPLEHGLAELVAYLEVAGNAAEPAQTPGV